MNTAIEQHGSQFEEVPDFGIDLGMGEFNINAAFQEAITGVVSDTELILEEKIRRMEAIVSEGTSEIYRDFVDFRQMAAQIKMICSHDHLLYQSVQGNYSLSGFIESYEIDSKHHHSDGPYHKHEHQDDDDSTEDEDDSKISKKKKRKYQGWFKQRS